MKNLRNVPFIAAKHYKKGRSAKPILIVIHTSEFPERLKTARSIAYEFATCKDSKSAHYNVDNKEVIQSVWERDTAWAAPPCNNNGIHIELAGCASQTNKLWNDDYSKNVLALTELLVAQLLVAYEHIPVRRLTEDQLRRGWAGITDHASISRVYKKTNHTDPGVNFPWNDFMIGVRKNVILINQ